jgi:hypothetical protein
MTTKKNVLWLVIVLAACGGSPPPEHEEPSPRADTGAAHPAPHAQASPWDRMNRAQLVALVREQAAARIREVAPNLDVAHLPQWVSQPASAPELGDRVSEQLMNLAIAAAAAGDDAQAAGIVRLVRTRARNRNNAYVGTTLLSELARRAAPADRAQQVVQDVLDDLPPNRFGPSTVVFQLFQDMGQVNARIEQLHQQLVSLDTAVSALFYDALLRPIVEHRDVFLSAIAAVRQSRQGQPEATPYAFSTVDLTRARDAQPVVVAVWDTGVSPTVFSQQLFTNEHEQQNARDDDQNGIVDDIHGVIADPTPNQTGWIFDPGEAVIRQYSPFLRGIMDLRAGIASSEAALRVLELMRGAQNAQQLEELELNLDAIGEWAHGTHVAGIMLSGVPQARLAIFRSAWAGETRVYHDRGPTDEELAAERANVEQIARFINVQHVRVVNASIGFEREYVEGELRHESSRYRTDEEVRARARVVHAARRSAWEYVFSQCPNTLFVVAAGNSNHDVTEYEDVPPSIDAPNVLVIGAVDRFGEWATFTNSNPERVRVFDHGVEVDSVIPSSEHVPLSGTSMASPNAANLATKMVALDPNLTPQRIIQIIVDTAQPIAAPFNGRIAHEERAIARVRRERGRRR